MEMLLAIETATSVCSAALLKDGEVLAEDSVIADRRHNETLPDMVLGLYERTSLKPADTGLVAISIGPGSFTGLRVGLSFAKGWALATGAQIIPVGTLEALAQSLITNYELRITNSQRIRQPSAVSNRKSVIIIPLTVARKGEAFAQKCEMRNGNCEMVGEPFLCDRQALEEKLGSLAQTVSESGISNQKSAIIFGGEGADMLWQGNRFLPSSLENSNSRIQYIPGLQPAAGTVGTLAWRIYRSGAKLPAMSDLQPLYLKEFTIGQVQTTNREFPARQPKANSQQP